MFGSSSPALSWRIRALALAGCSSAIVALLACLQTTVAAAADASRCSSNPSRPAPTFSTAQGQTCQTPCSLALPLTNQSVDFYAQRLRAADGSAVGPRAGASMFSTPPPALVPNPVQVTLQALRSRPQAEAEAAQDRLQARTAPSAAPRRSRRRRTGRDPAVPIAAARAAAGIRTTPSRRRRPVASPSPFPPPPRRDNRRAAAGALGKHSGRSGLYPAQLLHYLG